MRASEKGWSPREGFGKQESDGKEKSPARPTPRKRWPNRTLINQTWKWYHHVMSRQPRLPRFSIPAPTLPGYGRQKATPERGAQSPEVLRACNPLHAERRSISQSDLRRGELSPRQCHQGPPVTGRGGVLHRHRAAGPAREQKHLRCRTPDNRFPHAARPRATGKDRCRLSGDAFPRAATPGRVPFRLAAPGHPSPAQTPVPI